MALVLASEISAQVNTPPILLPIADQFTLEDQPILEMPFTVWDTGTPADQLRFSTSLIFPNGLGAKDPNLIVIGGIGTNHWFSIYPPHDASGLAQATISVSDSSFQTSVVRFQVQVQSINDAPLLPPIPDQVGVHGQGTLNIPFTVTDPDTPLSSLRFQSWSSRQGVVSNANLRISQGSSITNRNLLVILSTNSSPGSTAITVLAEDGGATNTTSFILTVHPPDFARVGQIPGPATAFEPVWGDFNGDGRMDLVASPNQILTNGGNGRFLAGLFIPTGSSTAGGAAADYDGDGHLDLLLYGIQIAPRLLRNPGPPTTNLVEVTMNRSLLRGRALWADLDQDGDLDIVGGSAEIRWLRNDGDNRFTDLSTGISRLTSPVFITVLDFDNDGDPDILGAASETFSSSPPRLYVNDGSGRFSDSQISLPPGLVRAGGWAEVNGDGLVDLWLVQSPSQIASSASLTVLRQERGRFVETFRLTNPSLFQFEFPFPPAWADFDNDGDVDFVAAFWPPQPVTTRVTNYPALYRNDGTGAFSTSGLRISTELGTSIPAAADFNDDGSADLVVRNAAGVLWPLRNLAPAPNALPNAPTVLEAVVSGNVAAVFWNEATDGNQSAPLTYNVRVGSAPGQNDIIASMSTTNGTRMIPAPGNAGFNSWMTFTLPLAQLDVETLYWSVQAVDKSFQGGPFAPEQSFFIDPPGNEPPRITGLSDLTFPEDTTGRLSFFIADDRSPLETLRVQATSSDTNLFSPVNVKLSGFIRTNDALRVDLSLTPFPNRSGQAFITLRATDRGGLTSERSLVASVTPVNDPPTLSAPTAWLALAGTTTPPLSITASDPESPVEDLSISATSLTPMVIPDANLTLIRTATGWQLTGRALTAEPATAQIRLAVRDPQNAEAVHILEIRFQLQLLTELARGSNIVGSWPNPLSWADLDGDRRMELMVGGTSGEGTRIHSVEGGRLPLRAAITGGPIDLGDIDNDGDVDLLTSDLINDGTSLKSKLVIYRNQGNTVFERVPGALFDPGVARLTDFDLDGRLDVLVAEWGNRIVLYRNTGAGFESGRLLQFATTNAPPPGVVYRMQLADLDADGVAELLLDISPDVTAPSVFCRRGDALEAVTGAWTRHGVQGIADFDQDNRPDLVVALEGGTAKESWRNTGALNFEPRAPLFVQECTSALVAEFDNDGFADVLGYGCDLNCIFRGGSRLVFPPVEVLFGLNVSAVATADFDGDGFMDLAASVTKRLPPPLHPEVVVYRSGALRSNRRPGAPSKLRATPVGADRVMLSWVRATDSDQSGGLTYNVRVGSVPSHGDVVSPLSLSDGYRLLPRVGNAEWNTNRLVTGLQPGCTYFWTVQAVDNSFAGGPFASEVSFTMPAALVLRPVGTGRLELELSAAPNSEWRLQASDDLRTWVDYPIADGMPGVTSDGFYRMDIPLTRARRFIRARRGD